MGDFRTLFSPIKIGDLQLKNRIIMPAMGTNLSNSDGTVSDRAITYYVERAKGGAGLIITESCPVSAWAKHRTRCICGFDDSFLPKLYSSQIYKALK